MSLAKEIKEEEEPRENLCNPHLFIPEPNGLRTILTLKQKDLRAYKLWSRAICVESKNLITQGTFAIADSETDDNNTNNAGIKSKTHF